MITMHVAQVIWFGFSAFQSGDEEQHNAHHQIHIMA